MVILLKNIEGKQCLIELLQLTTLNPNIMKSDSEKDRRIPKDKKDIKVTPFGTKKEKRDVPDQVPREEFTEDQPNKEKSKEEK